MPDFIVGDQIVRVTPEQIEAWVVGHFQFRKHKNGREYHICNPFDGDQKYKFNINIIKGVCHDWRPGHQQYDGSFIKFVQKVKNISFYDAVREVCGQQVDLRLILKPKKAEEVPEEPQEPSSKLPASAKSFKGDDESVIKLVALNYLATRGVSLEMAKKYDLHYDTKMVYFPYREYDIPVYWQGRSIVGKTFMFPENDASGSGKSRYLYGFDFVEPGDIMLVAESNFNAISLGDGATASGGAGMSVHQAKKIRALNPSKVILAPDHDYEGIMSIMSNAQWIDQQSQIPCFFVIPPAPYKDWNEMYVKLGDMKAVRRWAEEHAQPVSAATVGPLMDDVFE